MCSFVCASLCGAAALVTAAFLVSVMCCSKRPPKGQRSVAVLVLGDVGRSPRMQYHCTSLAKLPNTHVSLVGTTGERCVPEVESSARIHKCLMAPSPFNRCSRRFFLCYAPLKVLYQILQLLIALLFRIPKPSAILVQNPPSIPTLAVAYIAARLRGAQFVIDWHNLGFTVLAMSVGQRSWLVTIARAFEGFFARRGDAHLCVTKAMSTWLHKTWGVQARVLYDRAPAMFRPTPLHERHDLFQRIADQLPEVEASRAGSDTLFTTSDGAGGVELRQDRPAMIVSCTSWTPDEDFGILLEAIVETDARAAIVPGFPAKVVVVITGKGPQKAMYLKRIAKLNLKRFEIRTMWLEPADYPRLVGAADLGVSLHTSTSGLDLPMKVCAIKFRCVDELVRHNINGLVFSSVQELSDQFVEVLQGFPNSPVLARLRAGVAGEGEQENARWQENWMQSAAPVFTQ